MDHAWRSKWGVALCLASVICSTACRTASPAIIARPVAATASPATVASDEGDRSAFASEESVQALLARHSVPGPALWNVPNQAVPIQDDKEAQGVPALATEKDGWRFVIAPYGWLLSLDGDVTVMGSDAEIDESFSDIWENLSFVFETRLEAWKGRWGFLADITYARLETDIDEGPINGDSTVNLVLAFATVAYECTEVEKRGDLKFDATAGFSYTYMDGDIHLDGLPDQDGSEAWIDPLIGFRARKSFNEKWGGHLGFAVGGFGGITDGSDFTYLGDALIGRYVGSKGNKTLYFGYRVLGIDYDNGRSGNNKFKLDVTIQGPIIGFEWNL